ncbi:DNAJC4 isoform 11 [Pan troglodytes]|uniref:DnaJ (Hsp40) homolog, subfamily C, member 4, isoform CRA_h n=2 Tax=Homininae TaxID=207598 RepID=G3V1T1_HUMAN|nr:DnaJ (Hsp40) homolog, subfamily C, member 4, isoform CRA_h [Homo sapiens]PNI94126.1 DNAJC4 isoform 11 [Pan troglodytes]
MPPLLPLRLCRLWPRNPPSRLLGAAAGQRRLPGLSQVTLAFPAEDQR